LRRHFFTTSPYRGGDGLAIDHTTRLRWGRMTISAIVCAYNEARYLPACLSSLRSQTRRPDEILVINNASTDDTAAVAGEVPGVRVINEPAKGLVIARETA